MTKNAAFKAAFFMSARHDVVHASHAAMACAFARRCMRAMRAFRYLPEPTHSGAFICRFCSNTLQMRTA
ncbi:hypothetical protein D3870_01090 [Noviherbaspirillum cavernae]|uniref:Uncharacterized protein n=1 Tax=Noviherbaspirillum cavernae TaxID=2320862 RepID=A0A418WX36_9BURK|nr:hypothetical protein D3870_01090 [Noviherbaspirillum cavernae]